MSLSVREGKLDVAVVAGPNLSHWPSVGVRTFTSTCADTGLKVGVFGGAGPGLRVCGVIPSPSTGGILLAEDPQHRIHRLQARCILKIRAPDYIPDPFPGWRSQGLLTYPTAIRLLNEGQISCHPAVILLGTGNKALRLGSRLLEKGITHEAYCIDAHGLWGGKLYSGWEVERRRFEVLGGKIIEGKPLQLIQKSALLWELRVQDSLGTRRIQTGRVVSVGPFRDLPGVREHPPGSFLFELEQSSLAEKSEDIEGWLLEEERGKWLAARVIRALATHLGEKKGSVEGTGKKSRNALREFGRHQQEAFSPRYDGKGLVSDDAALIRNSAGVPKRVYKNRPVASLECIENIPCTLCEDACPEHAISIERGELGKGKFLNEDACTGCGICLNACPSGAAVLLHEDDASGKTQVTWSWRRSTAPAQGALVRVLNRRGDVLCTSRVDPLPEVESPAWEGPSLVRVTVPAHLTWEARGVIQVRSEGFEAREDFAPRVEVLLDGERRLIREGLTLTAALYGLGRARAEDMLYCTDGTCNLCPCVVDGVKRQACQSRVRKGMSIKIISTEGLSDRRADLCPCLGISSLEIIESIRSGRLVSPDAIWSALRLGTGKCLGQLCIGPFQRLLDENGISSRDWISWRFPWFQWDPLSKLTS